MNRDAIRRRVESLEQAATASTQLPEPTVTAADVESARAILGGRPTSGDVAITVTVEDVDAARALLDGQRFDSDDAKPKEM